MSIEVVLTIYVSNNNRIPLKTNNITDSRYYFLDRHTSISVSKYMKSKTYCMHIVSVDTYRCEAYNKRINIKIT